MKPSNYCQILSQSIGFSNFYQTHLKMWDFLISVKTITEYEVF